ncbi:hypothetical protein [Streptomyces sp. NPDC057557]|uniref:hypothetical protein n=1 Tax=Streptomyces sp. NPDC057557 TaxID=3346167 RepID=UPI0036AA767B
MTEVAWELGVSSESLRGWVKKERAAQEAGTGALAGRSVAGRDEEPRRLSCCWPIRGCAWARRPH